MFSYFLKFTEIFNNVYLFLKNYKLIVEKNNYFTS